MKIKWFGHSCFGIEYLNIKILTDPFDETVGYPLPDYSPDIITESHQHFDHNAHHLIRGKYILINTPGKHLSKGVKITGLKTYHDKSYGHERGENIIFKMKFSDGLTLAHCGDLGDIPDEKVLNELKDIDILMIPVGGYYTIDANEAKDIVNKVKPKLIIPMHFKTKYINFPISSVENFLNLMMSSVTNAGKDYVLSKEQLNATESKILLFDL
ncbi:L-ascorbate metabolism protein UlaG, beta-lactamase superfamily [Marinitoga hydrogenitolerans DSM 16785]|uniref:L-ascorbate metabolism protein UlaG, beta-lactamase superfamily n=1 Tax=Marinitoga hydrogenitolerans (strain DSM 16785 / JCM 12826 / AT1271) TaxID=1122195 RepID=A0A1M4UKK7_MARH1|nr:MBL fold metallo-hydrolase [Marinitoga hydrogenitolerans]SHE57188.1 L-ascorbate metabolism protein UlaG, beta-lactamase superfamily [Marinitoga hydrogenitolerans DSM 16785]